MATEKYPNQNVTMPMSRGSVDAARARVSVQGTGSPAPEPTNGKGSRREVRPGEWLDDRRIELDKPASPSKDSPPEMSKEGGRAVPASYDPLKAYQVTLGKGVVFSGRMLAPGKQYQMVGAACTEITDSIIDAVEIGDVPVDPDSQPS